MSKKDYMWVDPMFKKKIKMEALENDMTILEYTNKLAKQSDVDVKKHKRFEFKI